MQSLTTLHLGAASDPVSHVGASREVCWHGAQYLVPLGPAALAPANNLPLAHGHIFKKRKRKDYTFRRQFNEKPSIIPGCPGGDIFNMCVSQSALSHLVLTHELWQMFR